MAQKTDVQEHLNEMAARATVWQLVGGRRFILTWGLTSSLAGLIVVSIVRGFDINDLLFHGAGIGELLKNAVISTFGSFMAVGTTMPIRAEYIAMLDPEKAAMIYQENLNILKDAHEQASGNR